jgi:hypothetical protein
MDGGQVDKIKIGVGGLLFDHQHVLSKRQHRVKRVSGELGKAEPTELHPLVRL